VPAISSARIATPLAITSGEGQTEAGTMAFSCDQMYRSTKTEGRQAPVQSFVSAPGAQRAFCRWSSQWSSGGCRAMPLSPAV